MLRFALLRILGAIPTLLLVIVAAFLLVHSAPGGPFDAERVLPADIEQNVKQYYHLDEPLTQQFERYFLGLLEGDFGPSYRFRDFTVAELIAQAFPISLLLGVLAILLALLVGGSAGIYAALRKDTFVDRLVTGTAMAGISIPILVVAPVLLLVFAVYLGWLPASWSADAGVSRLVLPVVALALPQIAYITRLMRASMIDVLQSDFVRTARAQGLGSSSIIRYHALKPALLPLVSYLGPAIAGILTGSVVVEEVFGVPGLGQFFVRAATNRDYTLVLGIVIFYATLIIVLNLLVDIAYGFLDPRIRRR
jgi:oligopeptide transport system permease protein